jgi:hypothetical protein
MYFAIFQSSFIHLVERARGWAARGLAYNCFEYVGFAMVYAIVVRHQKCGDAYVQISGRIATPHVMICRIQKLASALFITKCSMSSYVLVLLSVN